MSRPWGSDENLFIFYCVAPRIVRATDSYFSTFSRIMGQRQANFEAKNADHATQELAQGVNLAQDLCLFTHSSSPELTPSQDPPKDILTSARNSELVM